MPRTSDWETIANAALGTCMSEHDIAEMFDCDPDEFLEHVNDYDVERCSTCDWWCEEHELDEDLNCEDCRE